MDYQASKHKTDYFDIQDTIRQTRHSPSLHPSSNAFSLLPIRWPHRIFYQPSYYLFILLGTPATKKGKIHQGSHY